MGIRAKSAPVNEYWKDANYYGGFERAALIIWAQEIHPDSRNSRNRKKIIDSCAMYLGGK